MAAATLVLVHTQWPVGTVVTLRDVAVYDDAGQCDVSGSLGPAGALAAQHVIATIPAGVTLDVLDEYVKNGMCLEIAYDGERGWIMLDPRVEYSEYPRSRDVSRMEP